MPHFYTNCVPLAMHTAVHLASQNMPMLRRLLAKVGIIVPLVIFGGRYGRLMMDVAMDWMQWPLAMVMVDGGVA